MRCLATPIRHLKKLNFLKAGHGMTPLPQWEIWQTPFCGAEIVILSATLQPTSAVGTNMVDMKHDPDALNGDDMVEIRLLVPAQNKVHTVTFRDVLSLSFRDDSLEAAMMEPDTSGFSAENPPKAYHLLRATAPEYDISDTPLTRWRIQDDETILEILNHQTLPKCSTKIWEQ